MPKKTTKNVAKAVKKVKEEALKYPKFALFLKSIGTHQNPSETVCEGDSPIDPVDLFDAGEEVAIYEFKGVRKVRPNTGFSFVD